MGALTLMVRSTLPAAHRYVLTITQYNRNSLEFSAMLLYGGVPHTLELLLLSQSRHCHEAAVVVPLNIAKDTIRQAVDVAAALSCALLISELAHGAGSIFMETTTYSTCPGASSALFWRPYPGF